jgi:hypothetical protein
MAAGMVGWLVFMLACVGGPAWSPDSSKLLFAWRDGESDRYNVAVYDRATRQSRIIFQHRSANEGSDDFNVVPAWQNDGTRAIVAMTTEVSDTHCSLLSIAIKGTEPPEVYDLGQKTVCFNPAVMPQIGTRVYIAKEGGITWLDLSTGESGSKTITDESGFEKGNSLLGEHNGQLVYTRNVSRPGNDPENKDATEDGTEFGQIELAGLDLKPKFTMWQNDVAEWGFDGFAVWEPGGSRIALVGTGKDTDKIHILDEKKGLTGTLMPALGGVKEYRLGSLAWSHDGRTLFAAAVTKGQGNDTYDYSLAEVPLAGTPGRLTRIASFHIKKTQPDQSHGGNADKLDLSDFHKDNSLLSFVVSLSPDGNTIAAIPGNMGSDCQFDEADRALFLVDMRGQARRVTRIPFPKTPKASSQPDGTAK